MKFEILDHNKEETKEEKKEELKTMKLSHQALNTFMMALQKALLEQSDLTQTLKNFEFVDTEGGLWVKNPPTVKFSNEKIEEISSALEE